MNTDSVNKWLILAANIGVIAGIVFLAVEIQQNSLSTQAQTRTELTVIANDMIEFNADPVFFEASSKLREGKELTPYEQSLISLKVMMQLRTGENVFYQHRMGTFNDGEFQGYENFYIDFLADPYNRRIWENRKTIFSPEFQQEIDELLTE